MEFNQMPKKLQNILSKNILYSVIYLDENGNKKAKVSTTEIKMNWNTKELEKKGFKVIEKKKIVKENNEKEINEKIKNIKINKNDIEEMKKL